jgi:predicted nucleotidyltransferase
VQTSELLQEITRRIVCVSNPAQIILFGSHARGEANAHSDIDVLVIVEGMSSPRQESVHIQRALRGLLVPVDVVVATPQ